jgi:hypothetical protein
MKLYFILFFLSGLSISANADPEFTSPGAIQSNAFSFRGTILQIDPSTVSECQQISNGNYKIVFTDSDTFKSVVAYLKPELLPFIKNSSVLYVRIRTPDESQSEIEILGNAIHHDDLDRPPDRIVWANNVVRVTPF